MSASKESESPSPPERGKITFKPPAGPKKSMLTHASPREHVREPESNTSPPDSTENSGETAEDVVKLSSPENPENPSGDVMSAEPVAAKPDASAALSDKMAKISSIRESSGFKGPVAEWKDKAGAASTLPEAMARVNRKYRNEELKKQLDRKESISREPKQGPATKEPLNMEDPAPGPLRTLYWFFFRFGRFANGVLLAQPTGYSVIFILLAALGSIYHSHNLWVPASPEPHSLFRPAFWGLVFGGGLLLGLVCLLGLSLVFNQAVRVRYGRMGKGFGVKVLAQAFAPLAGMQISALIVFSSLWGEAYWRGATPPGFAVVHTVLIPLFWVWSGFRLGQALCGLYAPRFISRVGIKLSLSVGMGALGGLLTYGRDWLSSSSHTTAWTDLKTEVMQSGAALPVEQYDRMEKRLGFRDAARRRELYLWRFQAHYIQDERMKARADALRLDRMEPEGSAYRELARGLNFLMQDRPDLALARFEKALEIDPACLPAHQWMALAHVGRDLSVAESHARRLMRAEPNVFHLQLLVRILFAQEKFEDIWEVMLTVDAPPEAWDPLTLYQGGLSARALGKEKRADVLLELAKNKGIDSGPE